jgi:putative Mg2+ transporter-C (MgtC) family protein
LTCLSARAMASTGIIDPSAVAEVTLAATEATTVMAVSAAPITAPALEGVALAGAVAAVPVAATALEGAAVAAVAAVPPVASQATLSLATHKAAALLAASPVSADVEFRLSCRLMYAAVLGACLGKERSFARHSAGVRTMALVAMGASAFTVCSSFGFLAFPHYDPSRMAANVASGVGFVGAGVITTTMSDKSQSVVHGLTTAAAIWLSAAVGVACGTGLFRIATTAAFTTIGILRLGRSKPKQQEFQGATSLTSLSASSPSSVTSNILPPEAVVAASSPPTLATSHADDDYVSQADPETHDTAEWDEHIYNHNQTQFGSPSVVHIPFDTTFTSDQADVANRDLVDALVGLQGDIKNEIEESNAATIRARERGIDDIFPHPIVTLRNEAMEKVLANSVLSPLQSQDQTDRAP